MIRHNLKEPFSYYLPNEIRSSAALDCVKPVVIRNITGKFGDFKVQVWVEDNGKSFVCIEHRDELSFVKFSTFKYGSCEERRVEVKLRTCNFLFMSSDFKYRILTDLRLNTERQYTTITIGYHDFKTADFHKAFTMCYNHVFNKYIGVNTFQK